MSPEPKKQYDRYINRDLSWLKFNARVLQEAKDPTVPLIERLRFLGIFSNNLDEFFKVRYATVKRIVDAGAKLVNPLGLSDPKALLDEITSIVIDQQQRSLDILKEIEKELEINGIHLVDDKNLEPDQAQFVSEYFAHQVSNVLMTVILQEKTAFPTLKDTAAYLVVEIVLNSVILKWDIIKKEFSERVKF